MQATHMKAIQHIKPAIWETAKKLNRSVERRVGTEC